MVRKIEQKIISYDVLKEDEPEQQAAAAEPVREEEKRRRSPSMPCTSPSTT